MEDGGRWYHLTGIGLSSRMKKMLKNQTTGGLHKAGIHQVSANCVLDLSMCELEHHTELTPM